MKLALVAAALLVSCPATSYAQLSRIIVLRTVEAAQSNPYFVAINGVDVVRIAAGERSEHVVAAGAYTISVKCFDGLSPVLQEASLSVVAKPAEDQYLLTAAGGACAQIRPLPESEGRHLAAQADPVRAAQLLGQAPAPVAAPAAAAPAAVPLAAAPPAPAASPPGPLIASPAASAPLGDARIYFYRGSSIMGLAIQPEIRLDGVPVGRSQRGTWFYVDRPAGAYTASSSTEAESALALDVLPGQAYYVESSIAPGFLVGRVNLTSQGEAVAEREIASLRYTGSLPNPPPPLSAALGNVSTAAAAPVAAPTARQVALRKGDLFEYAVTERTTGRVQSLTLRVDRADEKEAVFNGGQRVEAQSGEMLQMTSALLGEMDMATPPGGWMPKGVIPRGSRQLEFSSPDKQFRYSLAAHASPPQAVNTRAGVLQAVRIDLDGWVEKQSAASGTVAARYRATVWVATDLRRVVRFEAKARSGGNISSSYFQIDESAELIRFGNNG